MLPIQDIEPAFTTAFSICTELPLGPKFLDVLLVTSLGNIVAVECKLWRNPEARREVIAQVIDYAASLQSLSYQDFETAIRRARKEPSFRLYEYVVKQAAEPEPSLTESEFIDVVSKNLTSGRCLLLIVGDGLREEAGAMAAFLQQHAGAHFALALIALELYEAPSSGHRILVPSVPLQTTNIVRGIVRVEGSAVSVIAPPAATSVNRGATLTEDEFFATLDKLRPGTASQLRAFLDAQDDLHVEYEVKKTLIVRMVVGDLKVLPFVIDPTGVVDAGYTFRDQKELVRPFMERLAAGIPGAILRDTQKTWYVKQRKSDGKPFTVLDILDHETTCRASLEVLYNVMAAKQNLTNAFDSEVKAQAVPA